MKADLSHAAAWALLFACLCSGTGQGEEPKAEEKKAVEEKKAKEEPKAAQKKAVVKPKAQAVAIDIEAVAAPIVEALVGNRAINVNVAQVQNDAMMMQFVEQYRPMLVTELTFIRQICDLATEQRPKIKAAGEASLKEVARKMAELQQPQVRRVGASSLPPDPRKIIRDGLAKALKETLTAEQMAQYTEEAAKRTANRKRAAILSVVSRLDGTLCLTAEQREKMTESISASWQDKWEQWLMMHQYGDQYFPQIPEQHVVSHLNDEQKSVWRGLQKVEFGFWEGGGQVQENDGWWGDEPVKAVGPLGVRVFVE